MMVPFKSTCSSSRKQYIKSKPKKWGTSGIVYDFVVYGGSDTFRQHPFFNKVVSMGLGNKVVLGLCQTISNPALTAVYFDNFFTSLELLCHWFDNKEVLLVSNFVGREPITSVKQFSKVERKIVDIPCPNIVKNFNGHMVGVDVADMLIALYRTPFKVKKWYLTIGNLLDLCVINTWLLNWREVALMKEQYNDGQNFWVNVAEKLLQKDRLAIA
ncbi:hypothetical protein PR048_029067, partial [Dryococelus australis]